MTDTFRISLFTLLLTPLITLTLLAGCGPRRPDAPAAGVPFATAHSTERAKKQARTAEGDSMITISAEEQRWRLSAEMNQITLSYGKTNATEPTDRIVKAEYGIFRLLTVAGRVLDKQGLFLEEIDEHARQFNEGDKKSNRIPNKIVNGVTAVYTMYGTLASMYALDPSKEQVRQELGAIRAQVQSRMHAKIAAMEITATMAMASYKMLHIMLREADAEHVLTESLEGVQKAYAEGDRLAQTDEDRFLNGVFRTFELSQIWAFVVDPVAKEDIQKVLNDVIMKSQKADKIDEQIAIAAEHLYDMTHLVAMGLVKNIR